MQLLCFWFNFSLFAFPLPTPSSLHCADHSSFYLKHFSLSVFQTLIGSLLLHAEQGKTKSLPLSPPSENRLLNVKLQGITFKGEHLPCVFLLCRHFVGQHSLPPFACHRKLLLALMLSETECAAIVQLCKGSAVGDRADALPLSVCALRSCSSQAAQGQEVLLLPYRASWKAARSEVPWCSLFTQHLPAKGKARAARWEKQEPDELWPSHHLAMAGLGEKAVWLSQPQSFCAACSHWLFQIEWATDLRL